VVRLDARDRLGLGQLALVREEVRGVEDRAVARAVGVEHGLAAVPHDVTGGIGLEDQVGELGRAGGAGGGVEHLEALAHGDHHTAAVAGRVEAGELLGVELVDDLEGLAVEHDDAVRHRDGDAGAGRRGRPVVGAAVTGGGAAAGREADDRARREGEEPGSAQVLCAHCCPSLSRWSGSQEESPGAMCSVLTRIMVR